MSPDGNVGIERNNHLSLITLIFKKITLIIQPTPYQCNQHLNQCNQCDTEPGLQKAYHLSLITQITNVITLIIYQRLISVISF